jgi:hypothetical protein
VSTSNIDSIGILRTFLKDLPSGETKLLNKNDRANLKQLLENCWESLKGSDDQKTNATKIYRAENIFWNSPILSFVLERHGGTVNGSSRAFLHYWEVDVEQGTANIVKEGWRQLSPTSSRLDTNRLAKEVADIILQGGDDLTLDWSSGRDYVVINIGKIIPDEGVSGTTQNRRKRFNKHLEAIMVDHGWVRRNKGNKTGFVREKIKES